MTSTFSDIHILIAEDDNINRELIKEFLRPLEFKISFAMNGQKAVEMAMAQHFNVILMDIEMPIMNGLVATEHIREIDSLKSIPIIAMTAHDPATEWKKMRAVGMNDYITKPIDEYHLRQILKNWLSSFNNAVFSPKKTFNEESSKIVDLENALSLFGHNEELLNTIILEFKNEHEQTLKLFSEWRVNPHWEIIKQKSHSLKGIANYICANKLYLISSAVENAIIRNDTIKAQCLMPDFIITLEQVLLALQNKPDILVETNSTNDVLDTNVALSLVKELIDLLNMGSFHAEHIMLQLKNGLESNEHYKKIMVKLSHSVYTINYEQALIFAQELNILLSDSNT